VISIRTLRDRLEFVHSRRKLNPNLAEVEPKPLSFQDDDSDEEPASLQNETAEEKRLRLTKVSRLFGL
jgi:hypothetical protein